MVFRANATEPAFQAVRDFFCSTSLYHIVPKQAATASHRFCCNTICFTCALLLLLGYTACATQNTACVHATTCRAGGAAVIHMRTTPAIIALPRRATTQVLLLISNIFDTCLRVSHGIASLLSPSLLPGRASSIGRTIWLRVLPGEIVTISASATRSVSTSYLVSKFPWIPLPWICICSIDFRFRAGPESTMLS